MMSPDRFTDGAQEALAVAQQTVMDMSHSQMDVEHIVYAIFSTAGQPGGDRARTARHRC